MLTRTQVSVSRNPKVFSFYSSQAEALVTKATARPGGPGKNWLKGPKKMKTSH